MKMNRKFQAGARSVARCHHRFSMQTTAIAGALVVSSLCTACADGRTLEDSNFAEQQLGLAGEPGDFNEPPPTAVLRTTIPPPTLAVHESPGADDGPHSGPRQLTPSQVSALNSGAHVRDPSDTPLPVVIGTGKLSDPHVNTRPLGMDDGPGGKVIFVNPTPSTKTKAKESDNKTSADDKDKEKSNVEGDKASTEGGDSEPRENFDPNDIPK